MNVEASRHAMYYGLFLGLIFCSNFFVTTIPSIAFLQILFIAVIIYFTYKFLMNCNENIYEGKISYGQSFFYVIQLFVYASMILAMFKYLYYAYLNKSLLQTQIEESVKLIEQTKVFDAMNLDYSQIIQTITPISIAMQSLWINLLLSVFLGLILSAFASKEKNK